MKLYLFLMAAAAVLVTAVVPFPAQAGGVVIVIRRDAPVFDEVKNTFVQQSFVEQIPGLSTQPYYLDGGAGDAAVLKEITEKKPDAVFAVGYFAAKKMRETLPDTPIVAAMVYYPEIDGIISDPKTVVVSSLGSSKELISQLKMFRKIKSIGLLYSSSISPAASSIMADLKSQGVDVADLPVAKQEDIASAFESVKGRIQAMVVLPDNLTQNPDAVRFIVTQSVSGDIMPVSFNENMVSSGMFFSAYFPTDAIGRKSAQVVKELLQYQRVPAVRVQVPDASASALNRGCLQALKLKIPSNMKIGVIYE
ncbi:MAG TPA: ABC transporter substrate binding protein [Acidobacteriota bacterium]|nr:ABC transporter substrate binding protein [Acidobacteriota bacterium]HNT18356.1 ABC transporter substrate binding protein [Acidobacteriota bacterium]HPA26759.1 ABC transporter substrate binding protein [Acidobacteriota bacterium]HQO20460.1 ABC transporter substrate binding protein [Acidobacteriota bacterium]HQQ47087.1 ABC transporter substrate binding protein [Acidobacteriota bacterium]